MKPFGKTASIRSLIALALSLNVAAGLAPLPVLAADAPVRLAGQVVFVNKTGTSGMSAESRSAAIQRNLDNALVAATDRGPASVNVTYVKGMPVVTLGGFHVATVDAENARLAGTTPALLAQRWADSLRGVLRDGSSVAAYVAQLTGEYQSGAPPAVTAAVPQPEPGFTPLAQPPAPSAYPANYGGFVSPAQRLEGRVAYIPAGMALPVSLTTAIATQVAKPGDTVQAQLTSPIQVGSGTIPAGSVVTGTITEAKSGGFLGRSGMLGIKFNRLRTPDGVEAPISAHIIGGIGKYAESGSDTGDVVRGETWKTKAGQAAIRGAIGAGTGAALGTAIGAIAGRSGRATGRGAWSGAAIGGGAGVAQSLLLRKGRDVTIGSGTQMQLRLDAPVQLTLAGAQPYAGSL